MAPKEAAAGFHKKLKDILVRHRWVATLIVGVVGILVFYSLYLFAYLLSADDQGFDYTLELGIQTFSAIAISWILIRLFRVVGVSLITARTGKPVPRLLTTIFNWSVIIFATIFITTVIFNKDAGTILAAGGIAGAGLALALRGFIMDAFSGLVLDIEYNFKEGDWVQLANGKPGRIVGTTWRHVKVVTLQGNIRVIPNSLFASEVYENFSSPNDYYLDLFQITLDHSIPVKRAERIILGAMMSIHDFADRGFCLAYAEEVKEGGVVYTLCYPVDDMKNWRQRRHQVIEAVSSTLHESGLKFSETIGEYAISNAVHGFKYVDLESRVEVLKKVEIFSMLNDKELTSLAKKLKEHEIDSGDNVIIEGDESNSLFFVAEGALEVYKTIQTKQGEEENVLVTLGPGAFVGDRALLLGEKRSASVRAKSNVLAYEVTKEAIAPILKARHELVEKLSEVMAERERQNMLKLQSAEDARRNANRLKDELLKGISNFFGIN